MNPARTARLRGPRTAVVIALTGLLTAVPSSAVAQAAGADPMPEAINGIPFEDYIRSHDHALGSRIRAVEGDNSTAGTKVDAMRFSESGRRGPPGAVPGIDVSSHQGHVDWRHWWRAGKRFAYVKATEGTYYTNPYHGEQYAGSLKVGMIRGSYHFAIPNESSGTAQANYFVDNGGGWSPGGKTLPGALDLEYNPYGPACYGMSKDEMTAWIREFNDRYHARTGRYPVIYTSTSWWSRCVASDFSDTNPLWVARYASSVGELPYDWAFHTFWQYSAKPIDQNAFNAPYERLRALATG